MYGSIKVPGWLRGTAVERRSLVGELSLSCARPQLIGDHLCGQTVRYKSTNQANSAFHPFEVDEWVVSCNQMSATSVGVAPSGKCLRGEGLVAGWGGGVFASYTVGPTVR